MANFDHIIEQHIQKAQREGAFDNLPGAGKPLNLDDGHEDAPADSRMAFKILKNAGYFPEEVTLLKDINSLKKRVQEIPEDEVERKHSILSQINEKYARYYAARERSNRRNR